ncbi:hypothetical protein D4764_0196950 [Takifugu flavidus]|uniref:Uncharacterized protein n=1 Tax=Takifugu flavidus TaxID=433684 RepID=A0A5C6MLT2_9TELE|nr:hypothetical protein D4764_0196950 [Takifugu flavidus]
MWQQPASVGLVIEATSFKSRIKTDIDEALEGLPDNKAVILVVMHHTFDPDLVIVESRLQELPRNVCLTVDSLFYQGRLLGCNRNDIAWDQIQKGLNIPIPEPSSTKAVVDYLVNHKGLMAGIVVVIVLVILVIVIVNSTAGKGQTPGGVGKHPNLFQGQKDTVHNNKAVILVVMHHTFDPHLVIVESRLQELPRNVRLTVDSLFHQGRLLGCNRNDIAWNQIQKSLNIPIPEPSWRMRPFNYLVNHKGLMAGIAVGILLVILVIVIVNFTAGKGCSKNHTLDPNSVEADSKRQVCNRLPDLLLTVDCLFNEGKLLSSKHNKAAYMEIIKLIATSYQGYANKIRVCSSPQKVPAPELCVSFTPVLHQLVTR